jgi:hypothetical protein
MVLLEQEKVNLSKSNKAKNLKNKIKYLKIE